MTERLTADPRAMRDMATRFDTHAQTVKDKARRMWAAYDTTGEMDQAFINIVDMLHSVRDGLVRAADQYEQTSRQSLGS
ncbi:WXG100 family type VII secretion target [Mycobacterium montefiorense]|uniref:WXG100 family type VII secretion target n=1 Tax=Mycobacterium montefiorense TaxID=154654 RepID=UPI0021DCB89E|nr:ESAT-6-like protein EsxW [Mycobacterium montefiorense]